MKTICKTSLYTLALVPLMSLQSVHAAPIVHLSSLHHVKYVDFVSRRNGWITENENGQDIIYKTSDGGSTWSPILKIKSGGNLANGTVHLFNSNEGFVIDAGTNTLYMTKNDGGSWSKRKLPTVIAPNMISFPNVNCGWILGDLKGASGQESATLYRTTNGGVSWNIVSHTNNKDEKGYLPVYGDKSGIFFKNSTKGWICGSVNVLGGEWLYVTHDGGKTWNQQLINRIKDKQYTNSQIQALTPVFTSRNHGFIPLKVNSSLELFLTNNGGKTWMFSGKLNNINANSPLFDFTSKTTGRVAQGSSLWITTTSGKSWSLLSRLKNIQFSGLDFVSKQIGWAIFKHDGQTYLSKTIDGGRNWQH